MSALHDTARRFGEEVIAPHAEAWNTAGSVPRSYFAQAGTAGLCGLLVPTALGGAGASMRSFGEVLEILSRHCLASTFALVVHNNLANAIARHGNDEQRERYLTAMLAGNSIGAFLLTEPMAGSDAAAIKTRAVRGEHGWTLTGSKAWVSNAQNADLLAVYADAERGAQSGMASFLVDAGMPGVEVGAPYALFGGHALGAAAVSLDQCTVAPGAMMAAPGEGLRAALRGIDLARIAVGAMCCGVMASALGEALAYTNERRAFGQRLRNFQGLEWKLADCATDLEAARALTYRAADQLDQGEDASLVAAHAKKFAADVAFRRVADCMQALGANGLMRSRPLARHLEAAKIAQYVDGTSEIQNVVISRRLDAAYGNPQSA